LSTAAGCTHLDQIKITHPPTKDEVPGCQECLKTGGRWLHLRVCRTCGDVGCCDSSPNRHASAHAAQAGHPILSSIEPGEDWSWCAIDEMALGPDGQELSFEELTGEGAEVAEGRRLQLRKGVLQLSAVVVLVALLVAFLPGLGQVRQHLSHITTGWLGVAAGCEILSSVCYVVLFHRMFCPGVRWGISARIGMSELGVDTLVPAGGATGLALGAWVLRRRGMASERIPGLTVAFFLLTSLVNFAAVIVFGFGLWFGLFAGRAPIEMTLIPAGLATTGIVLFFYLPRLLGRRGERSPRRRLGRLLHRGLRGIAGGVGETSTFLRSGDPLVYAGAIGYWAFDNAVLWVTFRALGHAPPVAVVAMAYLIGQLGGALPIPLGIGGIDGGLIGAFVLFNVSLSTTTSAVLAYRAIQIWIPAVLGGAALTRLRQTYKVEPQPQLL
jgi:uncharacterized membrane protein YbhN (UPF0104 family)